MSRICPSSMFLFCTVYKIYCFFFQQLDKTNSHIKICYYYDRIIKLYRLSKIRSQVRKYWLLRISFFFKQKYLPICFDANGFSFENQTKTSLSLMKFIKKTYRFFYKSILIYCNCQNFWKNDMFFRNCTKQKDISWTYLTQNIELSQSYYLLLVEPKVGPFLCV